MNETVRHPIREIIKKPMVKKAVRHILFEAEKNLPQNALWEDVEVLDAKLEKKELAYGRR